MASEVFDGILSSNLVDLEANFKGGLASCASVTDLGGGVTGFAVSSGTADSLGLTGGAVSTGLLAAQEKSKKKKKAREASLDDEVVGGAFLSTP